MAAQRNKNGQFMTGNTASVGHGRKPRTTERNYMAAMLGACDIDDWKAIVERAVTDAKGGDKSARDWLTKYLIGTEKVHDLAYLLAHIDNGIDEVESAQKAMIRDKKRDAKWKDNLSLDSFFRDDDDD